MSHVALTKKPKKIGLALGGGGAKGLAHIGIIKTLKNAGIPIDFIAGTSMGALVGAWYAATGDIEFLENLFLKTKRSRILPIKEIFRKTGSLFGGESVAKFLGPHFKNLSFDDCKIPFRAVATDVKSGEAVVFKSGKLIDAVRASVAIPVIFSPVEVGGRLFMDGGLVNPVPADIARGMGADFVIAVDVSSKWTGETKGDDAAGIYAAFTNSLSIIEHQLAKESLKQADIILRPPVMSYDWLKMDRVGEIIDIGAEEARLHIKEIFKKTGYEERPKTIGEKFFDFLFHLDED